jgi:hypothetical protein
MSSSSTCISANLRLASASCLASSAFFSVSRYLSTDFALCFIHGFELLGSVFEGLGSWLWGVWPCVGCWVSSFGRLVLGAIGLGSVVVPELATFFFDGAIIGFLVELRTRWTPLLGSKRYFPK